MQYRQTGWTPDSLRGAMDGTMYEWRAEVCLLYLDAANLLAMTDVEYRAAKAAFARYNEKVQKLVQSKHQIDYVAGKSAEYQRQLEWADRELDRANNPSKNAPAPEAVLDPSEYAQRQRDKVDEVVQKLATLCDVAMSDDAYKPAIVLTKTVNV
jgi:hypothetical protein